MSKYFSDIFLGFPRYLFVLLGFFIPISVAITNIIIAAISFFWLLEGDFQRKINHIKTSKWMLSIFGLIGLYILGMFWGEHHVNASWQFQKLALLFVFPLLVTLQIDQKTKKYAVAAFLVSTFISSVLAILIDNQIIYPLAEYIVFLKYDWSTAAFISYNHHNVLLAFSSMICLYLIFEKKTKYRNLLILFFIIYSISIFTERGRAGQMLFNFFVIAYIIYYAKKYSYKVFLLIIPFLLFQVIIYKTTTIYQKRINSTYKVFRAIQEDNTRHKKKYLRYVFLKESLDRIIKKPILGYGTGSFGTIFENEVKTKHDILKHHTPHNQYLYVWFELGIIGLISLLMIFYFKIQELYKMKDGFYRVLLPLSFMVLMLVDSYFFIFTVTSAYIYLYTLYSHEELW